MTKTPRSPAKTQDAGGFGAKSGAALLGPDDPAAVAVQNFGSGSPFLVVCDHAGRAVPARLNRLGLPDAVFDTHIAWDIGAVGFAEQLARRLGSTLIRQAYSRLVIDCNRHPDHPGAIPELSDRVPIPGNANLTPAERDTRIAEIHAPYHARIAAEVDDRVATGRSPLMICAHSFTPVMQGEARPWHVGVLHGGRSPASEVLLDLLRAEGDLVVGDNQPYAMDGTDYTAPTHAWARGLDVIELEIRQDLLADGEGQVKFAERFMRLLGKVVK